MKKLNLSKVLKDLHRSLSKHSPEILIGCGIVSGLTATVLAVKATPKALQILEMERIRREEEELSEPITKMDTVKLCWRYYIPSVTMSAVSVACVLGGTSINKRRNAAIATAYKLTETAFIEYKDKVIETIGENKEKEIREAVAKDKVEKNPPVNREIIITERGNTKCYDGVSGRYFKSDIETIKQVVNKLNKQLLDEMYISLSEFYWEIGLHETDISDDLGWNIDNGLIEIEFSSTIDAEGDPCLVLSYHVGPRWDYKGLH